MGADTGLRRLLDRLTDDVDGVAVPEETGAPAD